MLTYEDSHPAVGDTTPSGVSVGSPTVSPMSVAPQGDQPVAYRVVVPVTDGTKEIEAYIDLIAVQKGRAVAILTFEGIGNRVGATTEADLTALTVGRLHGT